MARNYKVLWAQAAEEDLKSIIEYICIDSPLAARDSLKKIKTKASNLCSFPQRGRIVPELKDQGIIQYRELIIPPWRMIYRIYEEQVYVLLVIDSRRNIEDVLLERLVRKK
ncbi:MAG: plasmid stabilization protein [Methylothermaceae bacteria B42]|nr:MAG: plasmid stabilization protein [Methylothermaceae bacteria B42]HHJ40076.1 type II toxin-antitoxin system RelE/ParE family toxin [Methylothermaceae bacterium]